jgi:serine/threonine protein kinase
MVEDGYVKLSDFGVAKILPNIEDCRSTSGTHGYMVFAYDSLNTRFTKYAYS